MKTIALVGTFDSKGEEFLFAKQLIEKLGFKAFTIHAGSFAPLFEPDVSNEQVAQAAGSSLEEIKGDRGHASQIMCEGLARLVPDLYAQGKFDGILSFGGSGGTTLATAGMRELPFGVPKVMVSTMASGNVAEYVGTSDIAMMPSLVDVAGLNMISRSVFERAVTAIAGMVGYADEVRDEDEAAKLQRSDLTDPVSVTPQTSPAAGANGGVAVESAQAAAPQTAADAGADPDAVAGHAAKPVIAATMFGVTTPCVTRAKQLLEAAGCEVIVFHANGAGGKIMEKMIDEGIFDGVLDLTTTEVCDAVYDGVLSAGPHRCEAAIRAKLPQVASVGATDMINFGHVSTMPEKYKGRNIYLHNPANTLTRMTVEESAAVGKCLAGKWNSATTPMTVLLPLGGVSMLDAVGKPFDGPKERAALYSAIRENIANPLVTIREIDANINDEAFAQAAVDDLLVQLGR